jgi:hydroxysqualene synthase
MKPAPDDRGAITGACRAWIKVREAEVRVELMSVPGGDIAPTRTERDENFPVASRLIAARHRAPILAFYRFARAADDIADHPTLPPEAKLDGLAALEAGLTGEGDPRGLALRLALADRNLTPRHALDLLAAFRLDVIKNRYRDWGELMGYCALSAAPVGRFVLDVHGEPADRWPASDAICASLQVINHLQDCGRDFGKLDRVYLPQETLDRHRAAVTDLQAPRASGELRAAIGELTGRARALIEEGASLPGAVRDLRLACEIGAIVGLARANCARLEKRDPLSERVHPTKAAFAAIGLLGALAGARAFALRDHRRSQTQ